MISKFSQTFDPNGETCYMHVEPVHTFIPDAVLIFVNKSNSRNFPSSSHMADYFPPPSTLTHSLPKKMFCYFSPLLLQATFNFSFPNSVPKRKKNFNQQIMNCISFHFQKHDVWAKFNFTDFAKLVFNFC